MKTHNETIKQYLEQKGYDTHRYDIDDYVECIINGIKIEWRSDRKCLVIGFGNSDSDHEKLREVIISIFGENSFIGKCNTYLSFQKNATVEDFQSLVEAIENLSFIPEKSVGAPRGKVSLNKDGAFLKMAKMIKFQMELEFGQPDRGSCKMDAIDDIITIGESVNHTPENSYREHIVPCDFIIREAVEMFREAKTLTEVSSMIQNNLKIVLITKEEANILDIDLGFKTTMPEGWKIGDDVFARLNCAKIQTK